MYPSFEMLCYAVRLGQKSIHIRHVSPPQSKLHSRHKKTQCGRAKKNTVIPEKFYEYIHFSVP